MLALRFRSPFLPVLLVLLAVSTPGFQAAAHAQEKKAPAAPAPQEPQEENLGGQEVEITKPVIWSLRQEYYNLQGDAWNDLLILRADRIVLKGYRATRRRGSILRMDVPLSVNDNGQSTKAGLGDIYTQAILIPYLGRKFTLGAGSGLTLPTATNARLGKGKWIASPIVAPLWIFGRKGFLVVKIQDYVSFAGDSKRPDVQNFSVYPIFVRRFHRRWWTQIETESITDFERSGHTGFRSALALGRMLTRRKAVWIKPEIGWGAYRPFDFAIKLSVLSVK